MAPLYPAVEPRAHGMLDVGGGQQVYWEEAGSERGRPAIVLHGGPGSGCTPWHRRLFDPEAYRVVLLDQRGCGRSLPHAGDFSTSLTENTTQHLIEDIERLREQLAIERWLVWGGSWGSVLALAYAEQHPQRVSGMILWGIATGRRSEEDWLFRGGASRFFPEQWQRLLEGLPPHLRGDAVAGYRELLADPDPGVRRRAASAWCLWESATPDWPPREGLAERFRDERFAMAFARLVTHYVHHHHFVEDGRLLADVDLLAGVPAMLVQARFDFQSPLEAAWELHGRWPSSELVIVGDAGHSPAAPPMTSALVDASDRLAGR
ncbi:MAG TPA: prolyl aminopeptidase [Gaiellales bacterium]|nr:prolyl aminopeptidase [Gaiellales bacterium]